MITYNEVIGIHNNNRNNDESIFEDEEKSCGNVDMDSDCSQKGKNDEAEKDRPSPLLGATRGFMCNLGSLMLNLAGSSHFARHYSGNLG